jgi:hypothetical protein
VLEGVEESTVDEVRHRGAVTGTLVKTPESHTNTRRQSSDAQQCCCWL